MQGPEGFGLTPLAGGHSGETFLAEALGEHTVVRVYAGRGAARGPDAPVVDAAVMRLVRGLLPVPEVLEAQRARDGAPVLLVTSFVDGDPLDELLPRLRGEARRRLGRGLGTLLGRLACMPLLTRGELVDADLTVRPWPVADVPGFVEQLRRGSPSRTGTPRRTPGWWWWWPSGRRTCWTG